MNGYYSSSYDNYFTSKSDTQQKIDPDHLIELLAKLEPFLTKPDKDFSFDHAKQIYNQLVYILYSNMINSESHSIEQTLMDKLPNSPITLSYTEYMRVLKQNNNEFAPEVKDFIQSLIEKQIESSY